MAPFLASFDTDAEPAFQSNADPDFQNNADLCGYGFETLVSTEN
jgi:hypothetical protein